MGRAKSTFKYTDLSRALRAARTARVAVDVEIYEGKMVVVTKQGNDDSRAIGSKNPNPWDKVLTDAPNKKRTA
jgi:hypothetical protein